MHFGFVRAGYPILTEAVETMIMPHVTVPITEVGKLRQGVSSNRPRVTQLVSGVLG